jgi:CheY-specific phosphatase CheX
MPMRELIARGQAVCPAVRGTHPKPSRKDEIMTDDSGLSSEMHNQCVIQAAQFVLSSTCGADAATAELQSLPLQNAIGAFVPLAGDLNANVFLGLPSDTAMALAAKFAGFAIPFESSDMGDAIGELTNMLAGQIKAMLDKKGIAAELSVPCIMRDDSLSAIGQQATALLTFQTPVGLVWAGLVSGEQAA